MPISPVFSVPPRRNPEGFLKCSTFAGVGAGYEIQGKIARTLRQCSRTEDAPDIRAISREHEPMKKSHEGGQRKTSTPTTEPRVGIFWLVDGEPLIDSTSLSDAEPYGISSSSASLLLLP